MKKYFINEMEGAEALVMHLVQSHIGERFMIGFDVFDAHEVIDLMSTLLNPEEWEAGYFSGDYYFVVVAAN